MNEYPYVKKTLEEIKEPTYSKMEILEAPPVHTLNTLRGRVEYSLFSYWIKIPRETINKMGLKITNLSNLKVILIKKE